MRYVRRIVVGFVAFPMLIAAELTFGMAWGAVVFLSASFIAYSIQAWVLKRRGIDVPPR